MVTRAQPSRVVRKRAEDPARLVGRARRSLSAQLVPARFRFWYSLCVEPSRRGFRTTMISAAVRSLSRVPIPLRGLAVCVACEEGFELGQATCPSCGSDEHVPLVDLRAGRTLNVTGLDGCYWCR